jgi:hypothetical protein
MIMVICGRPGLLVVAYEGALAYMREDLDALSVGLGFF